MGGTLPLGDLARSTPTDRNRAVDLVRAVAILLVVVGHWLMAVLYLDADGDVRRRSVLGMADWTHPATWAFQVIPLVFVVGGYANAISWRHHRESGASYSAWLHRRLHRLTLPVVPLLVFWLVAVPTLHELGTDDRVLRIADRAALVPTWFIAAYVLIIALAPPALWLWERVGWWSVSGGLALALLIDALAIGGGVEALAYLNPVVVWLTVHQIGYAWRDGAIGGTGARLALGLGALVALVLLVRLGPYGVSMVGVNTHDVSNTYPTRATLAVLGVAQAGLAMALEPALVRVASNARVWAATVAVNAHIMTLYLWHLTLVGVVAVAASALGGVGLGLEPNTAAWWWSRPLWIALMATITVPVVVVLGRFEHGGQPRRDTPPALLPLLTVAVTLVGVGLIASWGVAAPDGTFHWYLPLGYLVLLGFLDRARRSTARAGPGLLDAPDQRPGAA